MVSISPIRTAVPFLRFALGSVAARDVDGEGARLGIAHRDQPLTGEDEGDGRGSAALLQVG